MTKLIIFDLDGVLVEAKTIHFNTLNQALSEIDPEEYIAAIEHLTQRKLQEIKEKDSYKQKAKLIRYLLSKGFEFDLVKETVQSRL